MFTDADASFSDITAAKCDPAAGCAKTVLDPAR
jgi:hypothetical protein